MSDEGAAPQQPVPQRCRDSEPGTLNDGGQGQGQGQGPDLSLRLGAGEDEDEGKRETEDELKIEACQLGWTTTSIPTQTPTLALNLALGGGSSPARSAE